MRMDVCISLHMFVGVYTCRKLYYIGLAKREEELQPYSILGPYTLQLQLLFTFYIPLFLQTVISNTPLDRLAVIIVSSDKTNFKGKTIEDASRNHFER